MASTNVSSVFSSGEILKSPGIATKLIDESQYPPTETKSLGSVPMVVIATSQNKPVSQNSTTLATGTTKANSKTLIQVNSGKQLQSLFGTPTFQQTASGTQIHGHELNEYGLFAAENAFSDNAAKRVYVVRADVNTNDLQSTSVRPSNNVENDKVWVDTSKSAFGINEWNAKTQKFKTIKPVVRYGETGSKPYVADLIKGTYVVYVTGLGQNAELDPIKFSYYLVGEQSVPLLLGSPEWTQSIPTVVSETVAETTELAAQTFTIEHWGAHDAKSYTRPNVKYEVTVIDKSKIADVVKSINQLNVRGLTASYSSNQLNIFHTGSSAAELGNFLRVSKLVTKSNAMVVKGGNYSLPYVDSNSSQNPFVSVTKGWWYYSFKDEELFNSSGKDKITPFDNDTVMTVAKSTATSSTAYIGVSNKMIIPSKSIWIKSNMSGTLADDGSFVSLAVNKKTSSGFSRQVVKQFDSLQAATYALDKSGGGTNIPKDTLIQLLPQRTARNYSTTMLFKRNTGFTVLQCENVIDGNEIKFNKYGLLKVRVTYPNNANFTAEYSIDMSKLEMPDATGFKQLWDETLLSGTYKIDSVTKELVLSTTKTDDIYDYLRDVLKLTVDDNKLRFEHQYGGEFDFRDVESSGTEYNIISVFGIPSTARNVHDGDYIAYARELNDETPSRLIGETSASVVLGSYDGILQPFATNGGAYAKENGNVLPHTTSIRKRGSGYNVGDYLDITETSLTGENVVQSETTGSIVLLTNKTRTFKLDDFFKTPSNVTINGVVKYIRIEELPARGYLTLNEELVVKDQLIDVTTLGSLKYTPNEDESGVKYTTFKYSGELEQSSQEYTLSGMLKGETGVLLKEANKQWLNSVGDIPFPANTSTVVFTSINSAEGVFLQRKSDDGISWLTIESNEFPYVVRMTDLVAGQIRVTQPEGTDPETTVEANIKYRYRAFAWTNEQKVESVVQLTPATGATYITFTLANIGSTDATDAYFKIAPGSSTNTFDFKYGPVANLATLPMISVSQSAPLYVSRSDIVNGLVHRIGGTSNYQITKHSNKSIQVKFYQNQTTSAIKLTAEGMSLADVAPTLFPNGTKLVRIHSPFTYTIGTGTNTKTVAAILKFKATSTTPEVDVTQFPLNIKIEDIAKYKLYRDTTKDKTTALPTNITTVISYDGTEMIPYAVKNMWVNVNESKNSINVRVTKTIDYDYLSSSGSVTSSGVGGVGGFAIDKSTIATLKNLHRVHVSNWERFDFAVSATEPKYYPDADKLWYSGAFDQLDIMVNTDQGWKGYGQVSYDRYGNPNTVYENGSTDALVNKTGPIYSQTPPKRQSDGISSLRYGDLWVDTSDLEHYPVIRRWRELDGINQWVAIGSIDTDDTTVDNSAPVKYADMRWSHDNTADPIFDAVPAIATLWKQDGVDLDAPSPDDYQIGTIMINTRRSGMTVKKFTVNHFTEQQYPASNDKHFDYVTRSNDAITQGKVFQPHTWVSVSGLDSKGRAHMGRHAQRAVIVKAMQDAVRDCKELHDEFYKFNLLAAPGYPELQQTLVDLNRERGELGYVIGDTPLRLQETPEDLTAWATNANRETGTNERGMVTKDSYLGVFYPALLATHSTTGADVVVPASHGVLHAYLRNDNELAYPWYAVAGVNRGVIGGSVKDIGIIDANGQFKSSNVRNAIRDVLYVNQINPITNLDGTGITIFGNKNALDTQSAMDRANVSRLVGYMRERLPVLLRKYLFEPNDIMTRTQVTNVVQSEMMNLLVKRGIYDFIVKCDEENNPPAVIDNNELWVDVAIEPAKAVEFVYIPIRLKNTGELSAVA